MTEWWTSLPENERIEISKASLRMGQTVSDFIRFAAVSTAAVVNADDDGKTVEDPFGTGGESP